MNEYWSCGRSKKKDTCTVSKSSLLLDVIAVWNSSIKRYKNSRNKKEWFYEFQGTDCLKTIANWVITSRKYFRSTFLQWVSNPSTSPSADKPSRRLVSLVNFSVFRIRIRIDFGQPDPDPEGKNFPQKYKKVKKFHVLKCWMFSFESWRIFL